MRLTTLERTALSPEQLDRLMQTWARGDAPNHTMLWAPTDALEELSPRQRSSLLFAHTAHAFSDEKGTRFDLDLTDLAPEFTPEFTRKLSPKQRRLLMEPLRGGAMGVANFASAGLTTSTTAYVAGDMLGTEVTWTGMTIAAGRAVSLLSASLLDNAKITGAVDLYFGTAATTPAADNAANSWSDANALLINNGGGIISFGTPIPSALNSEAPLEAIGCTMVSTTTTSFFGNGITRAAHTFFGSATDLKYSFDILYD